MTRQILLRRPSSNRRQPLLTRDESATPVPKNARFAEVAGGTTAECAAVCCCCPCGLMNLLVLAVYKLPAGLCRKALRKKRRKQLMNAGLFPKRRTCPCGCDESDVRPVSVDMFKIDTNAVKLNENEVMELEKEMWDKFYGTGFWRSPSQREFISIPLTPIFLSSLVFLSPLQSPITSLDRPRTSSVTHRTAVFYGGNCGRKYIQHLIHTVITSESQPGGKLAQGFALTL